MLFRRGTSSSAFGVIDIVSGEQGRHLASLALDSSTYNPTNTTSHNSTNHSSNPFSLNASSTNGMHFHLGDTNDSSFDDPEPTRCTSWFKPTSSIPSTTRLSTPASPTLPASCTRQFSTGPSFSHLDTAYR
ncbi:hypothetical protein BDR04DRAFT_1085950 [Suillus decipiens]|nr:hypothetical protein BDR04DRAFT_1085950 [Suillus decipiens]